MLNFVSDLPDPVPPEGNLNDANHQLPQKEIDRMRSGTAYTHNNPGHITFNNQPGATKGDPGPDGLFWAKFTSPEDGVKAMVRDIIDIKFAGKSAHIKPNQTLSDFIDVYSKTDRESYKKLVRSLTGLKMDLPISRIPQTSHNKLIRAMIRKENVQFYKENQDMIDKILPTTLNNSTVPKKFGSLLEFLKGSNGNTA